MPEKSASNGEEKKKKTITTADIYITEFGLFLAHAAAASLRDQAAILQTEGLLLRHSGTAPPLLKAKLLLRAARAAR